MWWEPYDVCKLETHHKFKQFDTLSLPRVKSIATQVQWVHLLELAHFKNSYDLTIESVGRFACLLCIVRFIEFYFFHTCLGLQELRGQHFIPPAWNVGKELGWSMWVLGFRVWGLRRRVGTWGEVGNRHRTPFYKMRRKDPIELLIYLFIVCPSSKL